MSKPVLNGLRVLDLCDLRGAMAARILADLGADVLRLPIDDGTPLTRAGTASLYRNLNKSTLGESADLAALLGKADVVIDNRPETRELCGLPDVDAMRVERPELVQVCMRDFGLTGPRSNWTLDPLPALASSGALFATGFPDRPPCWLPVHLAHDCASVHGALGAVAAVTDRRRHGNGDVVEVSVQEAAIAGLVPWSVCVEDYLHINPFLPADGNRNADGAYWVLPAKDGYVRIVIGSVSQWRGFVQLCGEPEGIAGEEWEDFVFRLMNADVVRLVALEALVDRTRAELFEQALALGTTVGVLHEPNEFADHPHVDARGFFTQSESLGPVAGPPWRFSVAPTVAPTMAEGSSNDWSASGWAPTDERRERTDALPLAGVKVVEFGVAAVVPELAWMLYELGADVIKVESINHPDLLRQAGGDRINCSFAFNAECRGRRSVALDLSTEEGREVALRLCNEADVVAENQRGGSLAKLGLDYEDVAADNPAVIYASSQGYGRTGPMREMPAFGPLNSGFAGLHLLWNHDDVDYPCGTSINHPDHIAGKLLAVAVIAALDHRERSGEGQLIDMAQTEAAAYLVGELYVDDATFVTAMGNRLADQCPHDVYACSGEQRWLALSVCRDDQWRVLAPVVDLPEMVDLVAADRVAQREVIDAAVRRWCASRDVEAAAEQLQDLGVSAMVVQGPKDHRADEHLAERGFLVDLVHDEVGPERHVGNPTRFASLATRVAPSARPLGAETEAVFRELLDLTPAAVSDLIERGIAR